MKFPGSMWQQETMPSMRFAPRQQACDPEQPLLCRARKQPFSSDLEEDTDSIQAKTKLFAKYLTTLNSTQALECWQILEKRVASRAGRRRGRGEGWWVGVMQTDQAAYSAKPDTAGQKDDCHLPLTFWQSMLG